MSMHKIPESAVTGLRDCSTTVAVHVLSRNEQAGTARVRIEDCGVLLRQGQVHTVPAGQIQRRR